MTINSFFETICTWPDCMEEAERHEDGRWPWCKTHRLMKQMEGRIGVLEAAMKDIKEELVFSLRDSCHDYLTDTVDHLVIPKINAVLKAGEGKES